MNQHQINVKEKVKRYTNYAIELLANGFTSNASKKKALDYLNYSYEDLQGAFIRDAILNKPRDENKEMYPQWEELYWRVPSDLHTWKGEWINKLAQALPEISEIFAQINDLYAMRQEIKAADVNKPQPKQVSEFEVKLHKSIADEMAKAKADYAYGIRIAELFGNLPVSINAHYVVNQYGTEFIRCFYYLDGIITKLSVIIALMQDIKNKKNAKKNA